MRRRTAALLVVLLVATAGCNGIVGSDTQSPTQTTTTASTTDTTTESTTATTDQTAEQLAPGLTSEGVSDALALANAHRTNLEGHSFVKHERVERSNASATAYRQTTLHYGNESRWRWNRTGQRLPVALGTDNGTLVQYADGERVLWRLEARGNTTREPVTYGVRTVSADGKQGPTPPEQVFQDALYERSLVYTVFANANVTVEDTDDSTTEVRGTADELTIDGEPATDVEFTATVTEDGLVGSLDLEYQQGGQTVEQLVTFDASVTDPVERPDWYETALNQTDA